MKVKDYLLVLTLGSALLFCSCKTHDPEPNKNADKCASKNILVTIDVTPAIKCNNDGEVVVHASGSAGFTYQIGTAAFQADSIFSNLSPGNYQINVKDADGCIKTASVTIAETGSKGPTFTEVTALIDLKCNMVCHNDGIDDAPVGIFKNECLIVEQSEYIKFKAYDSSMGNLDSTEKSKIKNWIDAGGTYID